ncbi:MAG: translocation/assembly module TamB domain-containing protein [Parvibaculum sp.]|uniref:translocation/assembly module TamB domain-containing protein n=1 Tax=Parvibaculum sp. TaxID=2024848 RepID=UPI003C741C39
MTAEQPSLKTAPGLMRAFGGLLLGVAGVVIALVALTLLALQVGPLRHAALEFALAQINKGETKVAIGDMSGEWPRRLRLDNLTVSDAQGQWLSLKEAELEWSPLALLRGELHVLRLDAQGLDIPRAPQSSVPASDETGFTLPTLPFAVKLDEAQISGIALGRALAEPGAKGLLATLDLRARLALTRNHVDLTLDGARTDGVTGKLDLAALFDRRDKRVALTLDAVDGDAASRAKGKIGLIALLGGLDVGPLTVTAKAEGLNGAVNASAKVDGGKTAMLDATVEGRWGSALDLNVSAKASGDLVQQALADLGRPRDVSLAGKIGWGRDDTFSIADLTVQAGALALKGNADLGTASVAAPHAFKAQGTLDGLDQLLGYKGNAALSSLGWRVAATLDLRSGMAQISEVLVNAPPGAATFTGEAHLDGSAAKGDMTLAMSDVAPLGQIIGQKMTGRAEIKLSPFALEPGGDVAGDFTIRGEGIGMSDPVLDRLFANFTADGSLLLPKAGGFALPSIMVTPLSGAYAFQGTIAASPANILSGEARFNARDAAKILPDGEASGALVAKATFTGTLAAPGITLSAQLSNGTLVGNAARLVTLDVTARQGGTGPLVFRFDGSPGKAAIDAQLTLPQAGGVRLDAIDADLFGSKLAGDIAVDGNALITASIKGERVILKPFATLTGVPLDGTGALAIAATPANGKQNATITFSASRLDVDLLSSIALDRVTLDARLSDLFGKAQVEANFVAGSGQAGITHLTGVAANARGSLDKLAITLKADGTRETFKPQPFSLASEALFSAGKKSAFTLSRLKLAVGDASMTLAEPAKVDLTNGVDAKGIVLDMAGQSGAGRVSADFTIQQTVRLHIDGNGIPLDLAVLLIPVDSVRGLASGTADLDTARGTASISFSFDKIRIAQDADDERPAFDAKFSGQWAKGRFDLTAEAQGASTRPFELSASLPVIRASGSAWPSLAARGPVSGSFTWEGPLASLAAFVDLSGQRLGGDARVGLTASGDISAPQVSGSATLANGSFENFDTGTVLRDVTAKLEGSQSQSLTFTLDGTDGGKGRVAAQGTIALAKNAFPAISISAKFTNAHLVARSDVDLTADGQIELLGPSFPPGIDAPLTLKGELTTRNMHIRIPERLPPSVAQIDVIEINGTSSRRAVPEASPTLPILLDVKVKTGMPARVSGRGLDSFWTGDLAVTGAVQQPRVGGRLESERGTLDFAGKTFTLSQGVVRFSRNYPIDPDFNVTLTYARSDLKATIDLTGLSSSPQMTLSSTPTLPQDEILARILFNKGVGELSAMEAVQLASTLAELSGTSFGGGGLGILDRLQETLNLDVLRIESAQSGATTVSAGKYIQKGVYVGVEQGALASDSSVKVEIEITPQISVDTRIGQNASGDVGVNWKWDY